MAKDILEVGYWIASVIILLCTAYYIATGPVNAVKTGRKLNEEQQKDNAKRSLFLVLFSLRGLPIHRDFVRGLNQIDVVFEDVPNVIQSWRALRASLDNKTQANAEKNWELGRIRLLSEMARSLGYAQINETEMMKDYYPEGHQNQDLDDLDIRFRLKEYLAKNIEMNTLVIEQLKRNLAPPPEDSNPKV
jgi:hypothetical protein